MSIRVRDLIDNANRSNLLRCPCCGSEYSAEAGDYSFWMPAEQVFRCQDEECGGEELQLVRKVVSYVSAFCEASAEDYEPCGECGFDHSYEYEAAVRWHREESNHEQETEQS